MSCGHSEDMLDQIQMMRLKEAWDKEPFWSCEDYPDNCDGQDSKCKRTDCPWFAYSTIHDGMSVRGSAPSMEVKE